MTPRYPLRNRSRVYVSSEQRLKLNYDFAKHVITTFQSSTAGYVQPFLEPVDPEEDDASDYYTVIIIKHPMDLSTMLEELEAGQCQHITDFKDSFKQMFANCFKYNSPSSDVYKKGVDFQEAFNESWDKKRDWIEAQIANGPFYGDLVDDSGVGVLYQASDDDRMEDVSETDESTREDDQISDDDLLSVLDGTLVRDEELSTNDDTIQDGTTEADRKLFSNITEDETSEEDLPPVTRRRYLRKKTNLTYKHTPKTPEHRYRARKKDGSKHHTSIADAATVLNTNQKRPLNTTTEPQIYSQNHVDPVEQSTEMHSSPSIQEQAVPVEQATKKSCSNIFQDHFGDSFQESQTEQPQPEPVQHQSAQPAPSSASHPDPNPLETMLFSIIDTQIDTTTSHINQDAQGQFTQHLKLLEPLCSPSNHEAFHQTWKTKAMDQVSQMQVQDILVRGVGREVEMALAETITEQARVVCEQMTSRAASFANSFGREE
jgi:hypothetical protein